MQDVFDRATERGRCSDRVGEAVPLRDGDPVGPDQQRSAGLVQAEGVARGARQPDHVDGYAAESLPAAVRQVAAS